MKKLVLLISLLVCISITFAQNVNVETEIKRLEQLEVKAILEKDSATLLLLWDKDYVVNSPDNVVVFPGKTTLDRPVLKRARISLTRDVEQVIIKGDVVFSMGGETVIPFAEDKTALPAIKRRYTNIWMKKEGVWKLVARHANIICASR